LYFLDQNIQETGEQIFKSNNGPRDCCYDYCGSPGEGLCSSSCDLIFKGNANLTSIKSTSLSTMPRGHELDEMLATHDYQDLSLSKNYFKNEDDMYLLNDNSDLPSQRGTCPAVPNTTISPTQCVLLQAATASMSSSASSITLSFSSSISITLNNLINITNPSKNYWTIFLLSLSNFAAMKVLLQLAGS
jgi:hypothetical protein